MLSRLPEDIIQFHVLPFLFDFEDEHYLSFKHKQSLVDLAIVLKKEMNILLSSSLFYKFVKINTNQLIKRLDPIRTNYTTVLVGNIFSGGNCYNPYF